MNDLSFGWHELKPLADELAKPIERVSLQFAAHRRPIVATLWRSDGSGLRIYPKMYDIDERKEVGVLQFSHTAPQVDETLANVPLGFQSESAVYKLLLQEEGGITAESGVTLKSQTGDEIVVVAGVYPYSLAIQGLMMTVPSPHLFEPEYSLKRYIRVPFV